MTAPSPLPAQAGDVLRCYEVDADDPAVFFMLRRGNPQGDTLILTGEPLDNSPGVTAGWRAYVGTERWREKAPLRPFSWYWARPAADSIRIGFVLPLWGIGWHAAETGAGLRGFVTYHSDEVGEPPRTSAFSAWRVACP